MHWSGLRRVVLATIAPAAIALSLPAGAIAEAAPSIASAPVAPYGQLQVGSDLQGTKITFNDYISFWKLDVALGDRVVIDWDASATTAETLNVFHVHVSDYNLGHNQPAASSEGTLDGKNELIFRASATGEMPVEFNFDGNNNPEASPGPYSFEAYVQHACALSLPRVKSIRTRGSLLVGVRSPAGDSLSGPTVSLELRAGSRWSTVGKATTRNGSARIGYRVPSKLIGQRVELRAQVAASGYLTETSSSRSVSVR